MKVRRILDDDNFYSPSSYSQWFELGEYSLFDSPITLETDSGLFLKVGGNYPECFKCRERLEDANLYYYGKLDKEVGEGKEAYRCRCSLWSRDKQEWNKDLGMNLPQGIPTIKKIRDLSQEEKINIIIREIPFDLREAVGEKLRQCE